MLPETQLAEQQPPPDQPAMIEGTSIRILSDEELFAMFPNRPRGIIGPPDSPQILFLDELK